MMRYKLLLFFLFLTLIVNAQKTTIQVIDNETGNPVSFTKISDGVNPSYLTDIDGKVKVKIDTEKTYSFRFFGYNDTALLGDQLLQNTTVFLSPISDDKTQVYEEVVITPGENPAHRIIQNLIDHKEENNPLENNSFHYDSYSRLFVTGELKKGVNQDTITDTTALQTLQFLNKQYLFLVETKANRTFNPPNYDKEEITAYNVSGVKNPIFATIVNQFQSFSFYNNYFKLGQQEYLSPVAPGSLRRYLFILKDTIFHPGTIDTTYVIKYRPHINKNFDGLKGYLYVNTKNWAIEKVIASPYSDNNFNVEVTQEYAYTNNKKWFPKKISTELDMPIAVSNYVNLIGRSSLYIRNVQFDIETKKGFNPVSVVVEEDALSDSLALKKARGDTYSGKEALTYQTIDSVAEANDLDRTLQILQIVSTGEIPLSVISIPIDKIVTFNQQEGWRLGLGLKTNRRLSKWFEVGGYFAYGFRDKKWKWGGDMSFLLHQKRMIQLHLHYSDDLHERGGTDLYNDQFSLNNQNLYRDFFIDLMDRERFAGIRLSGLIRQNIKLQLFSNYKRYFFTDNYRYAPLFSANGTSSKFDIATVGFVLNWNIRERVMMLENRRVSLGTKWPKITLKGEKGISGMFDANYDYYRFNLEIAQDFKIRGAGQIKLLSRSGITLGNVPLTLSQIQQGVGSGKLLSLSVSNTFETMRPHEFFSDRYSSLFFRFTFLPIKNKTTWTEPLFSIHSAAGIGDLSNRGDHQQFNFNVPTQGYFESGLIVDNLLKIQFLGIGAGVFYRCGPYQLPKMNDNFFYKLSLRFNLGL